MVLIVSALSFGLLSSAGGDAFAALRDNPQVSAETIAKLQSDFDFDKPFATRFANWLSGVVRGDLGESITFKTPVSTIVSTRLMSTLTVCIAAFAMAIAVSLLVSIIAVYTRHRTIDMIAELIVTITNSVPRIVLAVVALAIAASVGTVAGTGSIIVVLAIPLVGIFLAQFRSSLAETMSRDYIVVARSKGLSEFSILMRHAIRPSIGPLITVAGLSIGALLGGSIIAESVLGRPGIGSLLVSSVRSRDIPVVMGVVLAISIGVWLFNTLADVILLINDKRLRTAELDV